MRNQKDIRYFYYSETCRRERESMGWRPTMTALVDGKPVEYTHFTEGHKVDGIAHSTDERYLGHGRTL